jgi:hypothetical protein
MKDITEVKKDCFAFKPGCHGYTCIALNEMYCSRGYCKFYKTQEQHDKECKNYPNKYTKPSADSRKKPIKDMVCGVMGNICTDKECNK